MVKKISIPNRVLCITEKDRRLTMARRYLDNIEIVENFESISWFDIIFRKVRLIAVPGKTEAKTPEARWKRKFIKWFGLSIAGYLGKVNFEDCVLGDHGPFVLFVPANVIGNIYSEHLTNFNVLELKDEVLSIRMREITEKANKISREGREDKKTGITIFTNVRNDMVLRAYKKVHPNRKIIIRYHDRIDLGLGKRGPGQIEVLEMLRKLQSEHLIDSVESYYRPDAEKMRGNYRPNGVNPEVIAALPQNHRNALYRFVGGPKDVGDNSRLNALKEVREEILKLYPKISSYLVEHFVQGPSSWVPYKDYLKDTALSEVIVDLTRIGQEEGFSFRIPEALFLNRKIITNRVILRDEPFYSPERIFIIGVDSISRLKSFLESEIHPLSKEILSLYDTRLWWTDKDPFQEKSK